MLFAIGLAIGEAIISWGHWQFAPLWIIDYLVSVLLLYAFYKTRNAESACALMAGWAFSAGVFYMDLFVNLDPNLPTSLRPGAVVIALIVLVLVLSLIGFFENDTHFRDELVRVIPGKLAKTLVRKQILLFEIRHFAFIDDYIGFEVQDLFKVAQSYIEQMPDTRRQSLKKPDVRAW